MKISVAMLAACGAAIVLAAPARPPASDMSKVVPAFGIETPEAKAQRLKWWTDARFGMFIHWGIYAIPARGEWVKSKETVSEVDYQRYFDYFDPDRFDARAWAHQAKAAGMKYAVLTTKHHDGFCLFDSKYTDYKATKTAAGRDLVREFVDAFRAEGLKVGFYYSLIDWHHPHFAIDASHPRHPPKDPEWNDPSAYVPLNADRDMSVYRRYMKDQIRELLTDYGRIDIMWYDFSYPKSITPKGHDDWDSKGIVELTRELQPWVIIDNRLDLLDTTWGWDFITPEQFKVTEWPKWRGQEMPWETCQTFSGHWGYARDEMTWKTPHQLIELLVHTVSFGGNLIMNVGPTARGEFDDRATEALAAYGRWMQANGRAIYGCTRAPSGFQAPEATLLTYNPTLNRLYVHLLSYPMGRLTVPFGDRIAFAQFLHDGSEIAVRKFSGGHGQNGDYAETHAFVLPIVKPRVEIPVIECRLK